MSWVVDVVVTLLQVMLLGALVVAALSALDPILRLIQRRRGLPSAVAPSWSPPPPSWSLALLVHVDEEEALFLPSVQLRGSELPFASRLRLQLVDDEGRVRTTAERVLPEWAVGAEVTLPGFFPPEGAAVEEVLGWHWDVVLEDAGGIRQRWREHPAPTGGLNPEAELELPGVAQI